MRAAVPTASTAAPIPISSGRRCLTAQPPTRRKTVCGALAWPTEPKLGHPRRTRQVWGAPAAARGPPMARPLWSGAISFGLVNVPVRMFTAVGEHKLHFHYVHEPDGSPIGYSKICKAEDKPVPDEEIVKAFELEPGEWVYMTDEDFEAARVGEEGGRTIRISEFVPREEIDPVYFDSSYYLAPQAGAERPYALLARALDESGLTGIATLIMRDREYLAALRVLDGVIILERMHFADEVRPADEHAP